MFNTITWETFFVTAFLIAGSYYAITTLLLFHQEITGWFKSKPVAITPTNETVHSPGEDGIMGRVSPEEDWLSQRSSIINSEEVQIAELDTDDMPDTIQSPGESELLNGSVADLMQEIQTLLQMAAEYNSTKEECAPLFISLFERYPHLKNTAYAQAINRHICEEGKSKFSFDIALLEVRSWWEVSHTNQSSHI
jgi:hypothetical protein